MRMTLGGHVHIFCEGSHIQDLDLTGKRMPSCHF